jgi:hypothetical protein
VHIYTIFPDVFQVPSELAALTFSRPQTAAGKFVADHYRVRPAIADLLAHLANLGGEAQ